MGSFCAFIFFRKALFLHSKTNFLVTTGDKKYKNKFFGGNSPTVFYIVNQGIYHCNTA